MPPVIARSTRTSIKVTVGGKTVEVCCEECARKLNEAHASAVAPKR